MPRPRRRAIKTALQTFGTAEIPRDQFPPRDILASMSMYQVVRVGPVECRERRKRAALHPADRRPTNRVKLAFHGADTDTDTDTSDTPIV